MCIYQTHKHATYNSAFSLQGFQTFLAGAPYRKLIFLWYNHLLVCMRFFSALETKCDTNLQGFHASSEGKLIKRAGMSLINKFT